MNWLIIGLGNPGDRYEKTRHNIGFQVIDALANSTPFQKGFSGLYAKAQLADHQVILLKPQTFMNKSGESVQPAASFFKIPPDHLIVVHDEIDLPFGALRLKSGGGHGGNNGIRDIIRTIGPDFIRLRFGIGRPLIKGTEDVHVLSPFSKTEEAMLKSDLVPRACEMVLSVLSQGLEKAQNLHHQK